MRKIVIMLGCAVLFSGAAAADSGHLYRIEYRFSKDSVDNASFIRDRRQCVDETSTRNAMTQEPIGGEINAGLGSRGYTTASTAVFPVPTYTHHPAAFNRCMAAKGYRLDPNGQLTFSLSTRL